MCKHTLAIIIAVCISSSVFAEKVYVKYDDIGEIPQSYLDYMDDINDQYFHIKRLDLVVRLFWYESGFDPNKKTKNTNGTYDLGIPAINETNLNTKVKGNFIETFWKPYFPTIKFSWHNPRHSMFLGMAYYNDCLLSTKSYFDGVIMYNCGWSRYVSYAKHYKTQILPLSTRRELGFVFKYEKFFIDLKKRNSQFNVNK
jgi:hypothetical protein